jgi:hypothetical protein
MQQTRQAVAQNLAERRCGAGARRDDTRRSYRKQVVDGVYQLDAGSSVHDFCYVLRVLGVRDRLADVHGTGSPRPHTAKSNHTTLVHTISRDPRPAGALTDLTVPILCGLI